MCSLRIDIEENTIIEAFARFRFASVAFTSSTNGTECSNLEAVR